MKKVLAVFISTLVFAGGCSYFQMGGDDEILDNSKPLEPSNSSNSEIELQDFSKDGVSFSYNSNIYDQDELGLWTKESYDFYLENTDTCEQCHPEIMFDVIDFEGDVDDKIREDFSLGNMELNDINNNGLGIIDEYYDVQGRKFIYVNIADMMDTHAFYLVENGKLVVLKTFSADYVNDDLYSILDTLVIQ